jgi:hypothetical protein
MRMFRWTEIFLSVALMTLPTRLRWSRRSSRVLAVSGATLVVAGIPSNRLTGPLRLLARNRVRIIGSALIGVQYLLSEEESWVQGAIAGLGAALLLLGVLVRHGSE